MAQKPPQVSQMVCLSGNVNVHASKLPSRSSGSPVFPDSPVRDPDIGQDVQMPVCLEQTTPDPQPVEIESSAKQTVEPKVPATTTRTLRPDSFDWSQQFRLTFSDSSKRTPRGAWQARCLYHEKKDKTRCVRSTSDNAKELCKRLLMSWCLEAPLRKTKTSHAAVPLRVSDVLEQEILDSRLAQSRKLAKLAGVTLAIARFLSTGCKS